MKQTSACLGERDRRKEAYNTRGSCAAPTLGLKLATLILHSVTLSNIIVCFPYRRQMALRLYVTRARDS